MHVFAFHLQIKKPGLFACLFHHYFLCLSFSSSNSGLEKSVGKAFIMYLALVKEFHL